MAHEEERRMTKLERVERHSPDQIGIVSRRLEHGLVLAVSGEIDLATATAVERELCRAEESHDLVALDLSQVSFLDSAGLHAIVAANLRLRERGGRLLVVAGPPYISRLFELTGLSDRLDIVRDEAEVERLAANGHGRR
jgi:anti-anti-sigma factor